MATRERSNKRPPKIDALGLEPLSEAAGAAEAGTFHDQDTAQDGERLAMPFSGLNDNMAAPGAERLGFFGVILRAVERGPIRSYEIVIGHREEGQSQLFAAYEDDEHLVADWRSLGAELQLPLYILTAEGRLECATIDPEPNNRQRRLGSPLSGRRPRFLARRRPGQPSLMGLIHPVLAIGR